MTEHELVQHIRSATYVCGHILDVIITREDSLILFETPFFQDPNLCDKKGNPSGDHFALMTKINVSKPPKQRKTITYRKYRDIDISYLTDDLRNISNPETNQESVEQLVKTYNSQLESVIDKHTPIQSKKITIKPNTEWHTDELRNYKRECRERSAKCGKPN